MAIIGGNNLESLVCHRLDKYNILVEIEKYNTEIYVCMYIFRKFFFFFVEYSRCKADSANKFP